MPWHNDYGRSYDWIFVNLHLVNRVNQALQDLWHHHFLSTRFISRRALNEASLPMYPEDFEHFVKQKCAEQRELLEREWIPKCAKIILELKDFWRHLVPLEEDELLDLPMKFFACIAIEMSNQLRNLVVDSLAEFVNFFEQYSAGNHFEAYRDFEFVQKSALIIKLKVHSFSSIHYFL